MADAHRRRNVNGVQGEGNPDPNLNDRPRNASPLREAAADNPNDRAGEAGRAQYVAGRRLRALLNRSPITDYLPGLQNLQNHDRVLLTRVIIDYLVTREGFHLSRNHFQFWSMEIIGLWQHERRFGWFSAYQGGENGHVAAGRLWDRYNNVRRLARRRADPQVINPMAHAARDEHPRINVLDRLHAVAIDDHQRIRELWRQTFDVRDRQNSIAQYYIHFPQLLTPVAPSLFEIDYECMNLSPLDILQRKWPTLAPKLLSLARRKASCRKLLRNTAGISPEVLALKILPYLFRPKQVAGSNQWRPSALEQAKGFIQWQNNLGELDGAINAYEQSMSQHNLTCQPIVYAIGPLNALQGVYLVINRSKYQFANILSAVDACFKSIFALNAYYPREADHVWSFVERYIYEINVPRTAQDFVSVQTLISDLAALDAEDGSD